MIAAIITTITTITAIIMIIIMRKALKRPLLLL